MMKAWSLFISICWLLAIPLARADINIQITRSNDQAIPIAVVAFNGEGQSFNQDLRHIIAQDLQNSGKFSPLAPNQLIEQPLPDQAINFTAWQATAANYLVTGSVLRNANNQLLIHYALYNVLNRQLLLTKEITASESSLRLAAHQVADEVFEAILHIRGAFRTRIAYIVAQGVDPKMKFSLYVADYDGYNPRLILSSPQPILSPVWSPDGSKLAYVSFEKGRPAIFVQNLASAQRLQLTNFKGINGAPAWSPDGQTIAMSLSKDGSPNIYLMNLVSRQLTKITNNAAINTEPDYSPDGKSIIYTSDRSGGPQIYRINLTTRQEQRLTFDYPYSAGAHISPDGQNIYFVARTPQGYQIVKQELATGRLKVLTDTNWDETPSISPNGIMLIYATEQGGQATLDEISTDGRAGLIITTPAGRVREPAWSPFLY